MSRSVGYTSAFNGSNIAFRRFAVFPLSRGGAIPGYSAPATITTDRRYPEYENIRKKLVNAWNTTYPSQLAVDKIARPITTPFRAVNNAGDLLSRENYACGGNCQSFQSRPGMHGLSGRFGSGQGNCTPSAIYSSLQTIRNIPAATCNVKYVYDSSDYTTFLKQQAMNKNYNALSTGGDQSNATQSALRAIRRF